MPYKPTGRPNGRPRKRAPTDGRRPVLTGRQWAALRYEAKHPEANQSEIARAVGVTRSAVSLWQKSPHYVSGRQWLKTMTTNAAMKADLRRQASLIVKRLEAEAAEDRARRRKSSPKPEEWETRLELLRGEISRSWRGPVEGLDGKLYTDPQEYFDHVRNWRFPDGGRAFWILPEESQPRSR